MTKKDENSISRRSFIASMIGGAFVLKVGRRRRRRSGNCNHRRKTECRFDCVAQLGTWLKIGTDETVTILVGSSEMGQGNLTGLAQLVAEDLMVDWANVYCRAGSGKFELQKSAL